MAFDFPSSPTNGQTYTSGGTTYTYNGYGWAASGSGSYTKAESDANYVNVTGDTMTGNLYIKNAAPTIVINTNPVGGESAIYGHKNDKARWRIDLADSIAETGSNAGSNFNIHRFDDAQAYIDTPLQINRASGITKFSRAVDIALTGNQLYITKITATGSSNTITGRLGTTNRWEIQLGNAIAETGGNSGSMFSLWACNDAGAYTIPVIQADRSVGNLTFYADAKAATFTLTNGGQFGSNPVKGFVIDASNIAVRPPQNGTFYVQTYNGAADIALFSPGGINFYQPTTINTSLTVNPGSMGVYWNAAGWAMAVRNSYGAAGGGGLYTHVAVDTEQSLSVLNAAGNTWAHSHYGNGNSSQSGSITAAGSISSSSGITGTVFTASGAQGLVVNGVVGSAQIVQYCVSGNPSWDTLMFQHVHTAGVEVYWQWNRADAFYIFSASSPGSARKNGGGVWTDSSDIRVKNVTGKYEHGLAEVIQLDPVLFTYKGNDTLAPASHVREGEETPEHLQKIAPKAPYPNSHHYGSAQSAKEFIGLIAQEAEIPMPELVTKRRGHIDGEFVDDLRDLDVSALTFALVNAVKTLNARLETVEAKL